MPSLTELANAAFWHEKALEALAALFHEAWVGWMRYLRSKSTTHTHGTADGGSTTGWLIPQECVERWERQMETPYAELPETEKESDRAEARKVLTTMAKLLGELAGR